MIHPWLKSNKRAVIKKKAAASFFFFFFLKSRSECNKTKSFTQYHTTESSLEYGMEYFISQLGQKQERVYC